MTTKNNSDSMITSMTQSSYDSSTAADQPSETFGNLYASRRLSTYGTVYDGLATTRKLSKDSNNENWRRTLIEQQMNSKRESADACCCPTFENASSKWTVLTLAV